MVVEIICFSFILFIYFFNFYKKLHFFFFFPPRREATAAQIVPGHVHVGDHTEAHGDPDLPPQGQPQIANHMLQIILCFFFHKLNQIKIKISCGLDRGFDSHLQDVDTATWMCLYLT